MLCVRCNKFRIGLLRPTWPLLDISSRVPAYIVTETFDVACVSLVLPARMPLPILESLPGGIIEIIFLDAFGPNLARASNMIAAAVLREAVYDTFMI